MKDGASVRMPPRCCPEVEAMLAHERSIVPQVAIVRARALSRARAALWECDWALLPAPGRPRRLFVAAAASVALLASAAAAYQLTRAPSPEPERGARTPQSMWYAQAVPPSATAEPAAPSAEKLASARAPASAGTLPTKTSGVGLQASQPGQEDGGFGELRMLERAQKSDARRDFAAVLSVTTDIERRYPAGRLREERDALRLRALVGLGRGSEARLLATRFRHDFPRSVLLPKLDEMLATSL
jgi:hypothetical protein